MRVLSRHRRRRSQRCSRPAPGHRYRRGQDILDSITKPREDIVEGYAANAELMPADYSERMSPAKLNAVVSSIKAAAGEANKGGG